MVDGDERLPGGVLKGRRFNFGDFDFGRERIDHFLEEFLSLFRGAEAGSAGESVAAGLGDGIGEDGAARTVGIVLESGLIDELWSEVKEEVRFGAIRVNVIPIADEVVPDGRSQLKRMEEANLKATQKSDADAINGNAENGVVAKMRIDEKEAFPAGVHGPGGDLHDGLNEGLVGKGEGAGPLGGMSSGLGVAKRGEERHVCPGRGLLTDASGDEAVRMDGQMGPMLFGGARGKETHAGALGLEGLNGWPRQVLEMNGGRRHAAW